MPPTLRATRGMTGSLDVLHFITALVALVAWLILSGRD